MSLPKTYSTPRLVSSLLNRICKDELLEEIEGDLFEHYQTLRSKNPKWKANIYYWFHAFHFLRPFALKRISQNSNFITMYRSHIKFAWRNVLKHKGSTGINVASLGVGIACFIFIFIYLKGELSYDKFHQDSDRIYRVAIDFVDGTGRRLPDATTPPALAPALKSEFPEVESSVRLYPSWGSKFLIGANEESKFYEERFLRTDSTFFDVFDFKVLYGQADGALDDPSQIVITKSMAQKYFGREDVIGESLTIYASENRVLNISAVLEDVPGNSHFKFDFLSRITSDNIDQNWGWFNYYTYMKLVAQADIQNMETRLQPFYESNLRPAEFYNIIYSQPITDIHLRSNLKWELEANGDINNIYIFAALGIFVLLISCLNYLNLTVAGSLRRFKEVGVRKVFGAHRQALVGQFIVETLLVTIIALVLGSLFSEFLFVNLSDILGKEVSLLQPENTIVFLIIAAMIIAIGLIAGLYPALHLSSFKAANAVKGIFKNSGKSVLGLRKVLLVVQFAISAFMIFGTIAVYQQLQHVKNKDKGFGPDQVLVIENAESVANQDVLKNELTKIPSVAQAGISNGIVGGLNWTTGIGYPDQFTMNYVVIDPDFVEAMDFELIAGRNFSKERPTDTEGLTMIINETAFTELGISLEDLEKEIPMARQNDSTTRNGKIIGVVKDFHFTDYKSSIKPFAFFYRQEPMDYLNVKISTENVSETLRAIEATWSEVSNGAPLEYFFLDQTFSDLYAQESRLSSILLYLTVLALFIAAIGMFSIANMTIKDKRKEIAIRKVLGGSVSGVSNQIIKKFIVLVLIANLIAGPIAYFIMQNWLDGFAYRTSLSVFLFVVAAGSTLLVAWVTVGAQSVRAAVSNPVKSLRAE
ncbi:ABC transporter permease [Roseivirga sp. E12]|uniref:ABC transporter permease n=1 Tax=Roseivirga sp. E12 TaxID=2819237 RepID=UPI001ABD3E5A|nr:ABC transporter permease [Roseivirga sp. E12]MBO3699794.1 ABC transporter permease [Roseivirga sp. E12]